MADALRTALNGLRELARDHRSGAGEIADCAAALVEDFCRQQRAGDARLPPALLELANTTLNVQPSMAPLLNLANTIQLAAEQVSDPLRALRSALEKFRRHRQQAPAKVAQLFATRLPRRTTVLTYSRSSTVLAALSAARRRLERVILAEGRPLYEGRALAERLAGQGIAVTLVIDAALREHVGAADLLVVGADTVFERAYSNKVGTRLLQEQARTSGKPFYVLTDTGKFLPPALAPFYRIEEKPRQEVWRTPPERVTVLNRYFELVPLQRHVTLLSERGVMPQARVRAWVEQQEVARFWTETGAKRQP
ncbi:MAG: translation initiation factor eIF-2B [Terriglobia bacterium]